MNCTKSAGWITFSLMGMLMAPSLNAQGSRGSAELKTGAGLITIDYGRPSSPGKDRVSELQVGQVWRMGKDAATTLKTPVDLTFGTTKISKGSYSLFLNRAAGDKYELIFNSQTGQWGTEHDASKDVARVPLKKETVSPLVETFTIELKQTAKGGTLVTTWGSTKLSADFEMTK